MGIFGKTKKEIEEAKAAKNSSPDTPKGVFRAKAAKNSSPDTPKGVFREVKTEAASDAVVKEEVATDKKTAKIVKADAAQGDSFAYVLRRPRITEKAAILSESNTYVFDVDPRTNKNDIAKAIKEVYKVTPVKVNIINIPAKNVVSRGKKGKKSGGKKALVYLKKGDSIEII